MDRRQFFATAAALPMVFTGSEWGGLSFAASAMAPLKAIVLFDARYPLSREWACMARPGGDIFDTGGDAGALWHNELQYKLKAFPHALSGATLGSDFFAIAQLASDIGLRVAHQEPLATAPPLVSWIIVPALT